MELMQWFTINISPHEPYTECSYSSTLKEAYNLIMQHWKLVDRETSHNQRKNLGFVKLMHLIWWGASMLNIFAYGKGFPETVRIIKLPLFDLHRLKCVSYMRVALLSFSTIFYNINHTNIAHICRFLSFIFSS